MEGKPNAHCEWREPVDEIGGAIEGIDYPVELFRLLRSTALLRHYPCLWEQLPQPRNNHPLGSFINIRHKVMPPLLLHRLFPKCPSLLA